MSPVNFNRGMPLLSAGAAMLGASGPSPQPIGLGQSLGMGINAYQQGLARRRGLAMQQQQQAMQQQLMKIKMQEAEAKQREREMQEAARQRMASQLAGNAGLLGPPAPGRASEEGLLADALYYPEFRQQAARTMFPKQQEVELKEVIGPDGKPVFVTEQQALGQQPYHKTTPKSLTLKKVFDPVTQTEKWVPTEEAVGKMPPPARGTVVEQLTGGGFRISTNAVTGKGSLQKSTTTKLEKDIIGGEVMMKRLDNIYQKYSPDFLTYQGRIKAGTLKRADKANIALSEEAKEFLGSRRKFTQGVNHIFNAYRKEITGAQATMREIEFLKNAMINEDLGPTEFEAAYSEYRAEAARTLRLKKKLLREGLKVGTKGFGDKMDQMFMANIDDDIEARGDELSIKGLTDDEVVEQLIDEGYM